MAVWTTGVWATDVWADNVWYGMGEAPAAPTVLYGVGILGRFLRMGRRRMHPRGG